MDEWKLKAEGVDYDMALERFVGNRALYERFLKKFLEDKHVADAKEAYSQKNCQELFEQVHALKGVAGTLGMDSLYKVSAELVNAMRNEKYDAIDEMMECLEAEYNRMIQVLQDAQKRDS